MVYLLALAGLVLLFVGGEGLVRGSVAVARRLGLSELLIGLTLVGFGTSVPELVTSLQAVQSGAVGLAIGNVVGSNIANVLLILGVAALIAPIITNPRALARDMSVMVGVTLLLVTLSWFGVFSRVAGAFLVGALLVYVIGSVVMDRRGTAASRLHADEAETVHAPNSLLIGMVLAVGGMVGVVFGANLLVTNATVIARDFGVSDAVIGLSLVAIGTSLPELATSVMASIRGKTDVAVGNIIGSNIFNVLGILGITALVKPFSINVGDQPAAAANSWETILASPAGGSMLNYGDITMLGLSVVLLILFGLTGKRIARWEGGVLLLCYIAYMAFIFGMGQ